MGNRHSITDKLIEAFSKTDIGQKLTFMDIEDLVEAGKENIVPYITSARKYVEKNRGIVFESIRGVGLQRVQPKEGSGIALEGVDLKEGGEYKVSGVLTIKEKVGET